MHDDDPDDLPEAERIVVLELGDVVDLHGFRPGDVREVVLAALDAAAAAGRRELRLIHGRGIGVQRARVHQVLAAHALVASFHDDPRSHLGATLVTLRSSP